MLVYYLVWGLTFGLSASAPQRSIHEVFPFNEDYFLEQFSTSTKEAKPAAPAVKSLNIISEISNRYANVLVKSKVVNPATVSQEVNFEVIIPESAFISGFKMEIDGKFYNAYVKEKEEAFRTYQEAVHRGQSAAHVKQSARDAERFTVSVNIAAGDKVTFYLTYEELLQRELGVYRQIINIKLGQVIDDMTVDVHIKEQKDLKNVRAHDVQSANEVDDDYKENPKAQVEWINPKEAKIHFKLDENDQKELNKKIPDENAGQFLIEYDVDRDANAGDIIVSDGYFVHFFSPTNLPPLRKHVVFVLDVSGSMMGRKIVQLKEAMTAILDELHEGDYFNIIEFSYSVTVRNLDSEVQSIVLKPWSTGEPPDQFAKDSTPFPATRHYIDIAKTVVNKMSAGGGTNIQDALKTAVHITKFAVYNDTGDSQNKPSERPQPIILFLTDGEPTAGETRPSKLRSAVSGINSNPQASIFSLAFGSGADFKFLKDLSLENAGFARRIYEAADSASQLKNFYNKISSPLLSQVKFSYPPEEVDSETVTKRKFNYLFDGSELVIAGKYKTDITGGQVEGISKVDSKRFDLQSPIQIDRKFGALERLWAYMTIKQLLEENDLLSGSMAQRAGYPDPIDKSNGTSKPHPKDEALRIALKYHFVCPLTSLVVVKPEGTSIKDTESAIPDNNGPMFLPQAQGRVHVQSARDRVVAAPEAFHRRAWFVPDRSVSSTFSRRVSFGPGPKSRIVFSGLSSQASFPQFDLGFINHYHLSTHRPILQTHTDGVERLDVGVVDDTTNSPSPLDSIKWLSSVRVGDEIVLNNGSTKLLLNPPSDLNETLPCAADGKSGVCRALVHCVSENITQDMTAYFDNFRCDLPSGYAGVCCNLTEPTTLTIETSSSLPSTASIPTTPTIDTTPSIPTTPAMPITTLSDSSTDLTEGTTHNELVTTIQGRTDIEDSTISDTSETSEKDTEITTESTLTESNVLVDSTTEASG